MFTYYRRKIHVLPTVQPEIAIDQNTTVPCYPCNVRTYIYSEPGLRQKSQAFGPNFTINTPH